MKLNQQKKRVLILAAVFALLLAVYFIWVAPLIAETSGDTPAVELMDGEVLINNNLTTFYMFEPIKRASMQAIEVQNAYGGYRIFRDATDTFQLEGYANLPFDSQLFSSLVVSTGTPTVMERVATGLDEKGLEEFGLATPQASWTITDLNGKKTTVYVGDNLITEGGYYVMMEGRSAVYIMSSTIADTVLKPAHALLRPLLTAGMSQNNYFYTDTFTVWHGKELFLNVERVPTAEMANPDSIVELRMLYPLSAEKTPYPINDTLYFEALYQFITLEGEEVVAFLPADEELATYGLNEPAYCINFTFKDPSDSSGSVYEYALFVSEQQKDGSYYAISNMYGYSMVCRVAEEYLGWLEKDKFDWIFPTPFFEDIRDLARITLRTTDGRVDVDFRLSHDVASDGTTAVLDVTEENSGTLIRNKEVKNFREYYKTLLNITNQEYAALSQADLEALTSSDDNLIMTMTYESVSGDNYCEYKFYRYAEASTGHVSSGKVFVTVNGIGEFYTTNDLVDKIINDTPRVLKGLDIDPYGHR